MDWSNGTPVYLMDDFSEIIKCEERGLVHCVQLLLGYFILTFFVLSRRKSLLFRALGCSISELMKVLTSS